MNKLFFCFLFFVPGILSLAQTPTFTISSSQDTICQGRSVSLNVMGPAAPSGTSTVIGLQSDLNSSTSYPCVYGNFYKNSKHQMLYTANELINAGLTAGYINSLTFFVQNANNSNALPNLTIKLALVSKDTLSNDGMFDTASFFQVYQVPSYSIVVGANNHLFNNSFFWDGSSNILVEVCYSQTNTYTQNANMNMTLQPKYLCKYIRMDGAPACPYSISGVMASNYRPDIAFNSTFAQGNSYIWQTTAGGPALSNSMFCTDSPSVTTNYSVTIINSVSGDTTIETKQVVVKTFPLLTLSSTPSLSANICNTIGTVSLTGTPSGGYFSGAGVTGNSYNPSALTYYSTIYYVYDNLNGCKDSIGYATRVFNCNEVWPGDVNEDGQVDYFDYFDLYAYLGATGVNRPGANINFTGQACADWGTSIYNGMDMKFADCDGNGLVAEDDTSAILLNYGNFHLAKASQLNSTDQIKLLASNNLVYSEDTVSISIILGDSLAVVDSLYALGIQLAVDTSLFYLNSAKIYYNPSFIETTGMNSSSFSKPLFNSNLVVGGILRKNRTHSSGYGKIGELRIKAKTVNAQYNAIFSIQKATVVDSNFNAKPLSYVNDTVLVMYDFTSLKENSLNQEKFSLFPNPVSSIINVNYYGEEIVSGIEVLNFLGQKVFSTVINQTSDSIKLNLRELPGGLYTINLITNNQIYSKRFVRRD